MRLIVMWSVPFNLNLYDTYMGLALIYNEVEERKKSINQWKFLLNERANIVLVGIFNDVKQK